MSFGDAICTALLLVLGGSAITGAVWSDAEPAVHSFADVAHLRHLRRFELEIRSSSAEWYREGMQLFTFSHTGFYWEKKHITWSLYNYTNSMSRARIEQILAAAFAKWAAVTTKTFEKVEYNQKADIWIEFGHTEEHTRDGRMMCGLPIWPYEKKMDIGRGALIIEHRVEWSDTTSSSWRNLAFVALQLIGQILGLSNSECPGSIYHASNRGLEAKNDPKLHEDDIRGIQALYGAPPGWPTRMSGHMNPVSAPRPPPGPTPTFGRMNPVSARRSAPRPSGWPTRSFGRTNPVSAPRSSSSSSDDDTTETTSSGGSSDDDDSSDDSD